MLWLQILLSVISVTVGLMNYLNYLDLAAIKGKILFL